MNITTKRAAVLAAFLGLEVIGLVAWSAMRISVAAGHSVRFLVDSGNGGTWTPVSALLDTLNLLQLDIESAAPTFHVGWSSGCEAG